MLRAVRHSWSCPVPFGTGELRCVPLGTVGSVLCNSARESCVACRLAQQDVSCAIRHGRVTLRAVWHSNCEPWLRGEARAVAKTWVQDATFLGKQR